MHDAHFSPDIDGCVNLSDVIRDDRCRVVVDDFFELIDPDKLDYPFYDSFDRVGDGLLLLALNLFR